MSFHLGHAVAEACKPSAAASRRMRSRSCRVLLLAAATAAALAGPVLAAEPRAPAPAEPPATAAAEPGLFKRATLTGDWGGQRAALEESGVELGLTLYQDTMSVRGGAQRRKSSPGLLEPTLGLDFDRLAGWKGAHAFLRGIGTYGRDPAEASGSLNAPSNLGNAVTTFKLLEGWVEQAFMEEQLTVRFGLYAADTEFDVKETAGVFMNGGFGTGVDLSQSGLNGPCTFPTSCLGVRVAYRPTPAHYAVLAVLDGVAGDPDNPRRTHVHLGGGDGALVLSEFGYQQGADEGRFLRAALGIWHYTGRFDDLLDVDAEGNPLRRRGSGGVYALLEGEIFREADQRSQGLSGFLRVGVADADVNPVRRYMSAGLAYTGLIPGRDEDVIGLGVSVPVNGQKYRLAQQLAGTPAERREVAIELAYRMQVAPWMSLQFDAQHISNPGTDPSLPNARILGMRAQLTF